MKPSFPIVRCLLALPLAIGIAYWLDRWDGAVWEGFSGRPYAWVTTFTRILNAAVLLVLAWLVFHRTPPSRLVALVYLLTGLALTFLRPLVILSLEPQFGGLRWLLSPIGELPSFLLGSAAVSHFTFAFFIAIGIGGLLRLRG